MKELRELFTPRDVPLLFVVLPQAYVVGLWQWSSSGYSNTAQWPLAAWVALFFAILGGIGYEAIYVGSLAWARKLHNARGAHGWAFATALLALVFSVGVAVYQYRAQEYAAWLHAGLPIVGFFYTVMTFAAHKADHAQPAPVIAEEPARAPAPALHLVAARVEIPAQPVYTPPVAVEIPAQAAPAPKIRAPRRVTPKAAQAAHDDPRTAQREQYRALLAQGMSGRAAAKAVGVSESTARGWR